MKLLNFKHLQEVNENYFDHAKFGLWVAGIQFLLSVMGTIHAIIPFMFARWPEKLTNYLIKKSKERTQKVRRSLKSKGVF